MIFKITIAAAVMGSFLLLLSMWNDLHAKLQSADQISRSQLQFQAKQLEIEAQQLAIEEKEQELLERSTAARR
jgi:hypothetical protein